MLRVGGCDRGGVVCLRSSESLDAISVWRRVVSREIFTNAEFCTRFVSRALNVCADYISLLW